MRVSGSGKMAALAHLSRAQKRAILLVADGSLAVLALLLTGAILGLQAPAIAGRMTVALPLAAGLGVAVSAALGMQRVTQVRQLGASFPVFLSGGVRKVNVLAPFGKAFRRSSVVTRVVVLDH